MEFDILSIRSKMKKKLEAGRYEHTLGVAFTCTALAMRYGYDLQKAEVAGLLHDCAKQYSDAQLLNKAEKYDIEINKYERKNPSLLHAKVGASVAFHKYKIEDEEILNAIRCHTTGKPQMNLIEKILYLADYIEPRRYKAGNLTEIRKIAFINLDQAVCMIMNDTLAYLRKRGAVIDETTLSACEYYKTLECTLQLPESR